MDAKKNSYSTLRDKWVDQHRKLQASLWEKHGDALQWITSTFSPNQLAAGSLGGLMLLSAPAAGAFSLPRTSQAQELVVKEIDKEMFLVLDLAKFLPQEIRPLSRHEKDTITKILSQKFGFRVAHTIDGKRLNRSYGYIGAEQHLARYPGDSIATHFDTEEESLTFSSSGMALGLGAWGYFAFSKDALTEKDKLREKYYIAVPTFLAEDFNTRVAEYRDFFKYRKMLVVNPQNGRAIVVVIGDSGPAEWTGKHLGGSPEVMSHLERFDGSQKGSVLYFFIDDPKDIVQLGPIKI